MSERSQVLLRLDPELLELANEKWEEYGFSNRHEMLVDFIELGLKDYEKDTRTMRKNIYKRVHAVIKAEAAGEIELDA